MLHWDFLYLGDSVGNCKYLLVLKDGLTHFCELVACDSPTSAVATSGLVDWSKRFGPPQNLISDQGSLFKNEVVQQLCRQLGIEQDLVLAYASWINGTIERLNRDVLQVLRVLLMEMKLDTHEWEYLVPTVQGILNHTPVASLGNKSPGELFTALPRPTPFEAVVVQRNGKPMVVSEPVNIPNDMVERMQRSLRDMHKEVEDIRERRRLQNMSRSNGVPCNFSVGDFVLWSRIDSRLSVNKLLARWVGPFEVVEEHPHSYMIRHLLDNQRYMVHGSRLKFSRDGSLGTSEELLAHVGNQGMVLGVEKFKDHRKVPQGWQLLVSWVGLQDEEDSWEFLQALNDDLPGRVAAYIEDSGDDELVQALAALCRRSSD